MKTILPQDSFKIFWKFHVHNSFLSLAMQNALRVDPQHWIVKHAFKNFYPIPKKSYNFSLKKMQKKNSQLSKAFQLPIGTNQFGGKLNMLVKTIRLIFVNLRQIFAILNFREWSSFMKVFCEASWMQIFAIEYDVKTNFKR